MKKVFIWGLLAGFAVVTLFWAASPYLIRPLANSVLADYQMSLADDSFIRINPFELSLEASDVALLHEDKTLVSFDSFLLDVAPSQMVFKQLAVNTFELDGLRTQVAFENDKPLINGVDVLALFTQSKDRSEQSKQVETSSETVEQAPKEQAKSETESSFALILRRILLTNLDVTLEQVPLTAYAQLKNLMLEDVEIVSGKIQLNSELNTKLALTLQNAAEPITFATDISSKVGLKMLATESPVIEVAPFNLSLKQTKATAQGYQVELSQISLAGSAVKMQQTEQSPLISGNMAFLLKQLSVKPESVDGHTLQLAEIDIPSIEISSPDGSQAVPSVEVANVNLTQLNAMVSQDNDLKPLLALASLNVNDLQLKPQGLAISEILLGKLDIAAEMSADKQLTPLYLAKTTNADDEQNNQVEEEPKQSPEQLEDAEGVGAEAPPFSFTIGAFRNTQPIDIHFTDQSVKPVFKAHAFFDSVELVDLNSAQPELATKIAIQGGLKEYTDIQLKAQLLPFLAQPEYSARGAVKELSLPELSPYVSSTLGYHIESGVLDTQFDVQIVDNQLQGKSESNLKSVDLTAIDLEGEEQSVSGGAISLNAALSMLKDSDGNVELDIPISGDLNNPSVGLSGVVGLVVKQATMAAAKDYLITTFLPYAKVVKIAMSAGGELLKMDFEPLPFTAEQTAISPEQGEYLTQLADVLAKQVDVKVKLCGYALASEWPGADADERRQFAKTRADSVKRYLVDSFDIASERLYSCAAKIDQDLENAPRVEFEQL